MSDLLCDYTRNAPAWAKESEFDKYGNVRCKVCNTKQSPYFRDCVKCCQHNTLVFEEDWIGNDDTGVWGVKCECRDCGKNFGFTNKVLKDEYVVVRKQQVT